MQMINSLYKITGLYHLL